MTGTRNSKGGSTDEDQRLRDDRPVKSQNRKQGLVGQTTPSFESDSTDSTPEYHGSWYRNETMREEARATVEGQVAWLNEIDDKAMRTLRFNAVLLGLVVPVFSFSVKFGLVTEMRAFYTPYTAFGIVSLIISTALAGLTYTSSSIDTGISSDDIHAANRRGLTDEEVHDVLLSSYAKWIRSNRSTVHWNAVLITLTVFLTIAAFVFLTLSLASAIFGGIPTSVEYSAYVGLFVVAILSEVI